MSSSPSSFKDNIVYDRFIKSSLGVLLPDCMKELNQKKPSDPIEFIAHYLYKAQDSTMYMQAKQKFLRDCLDGAAELKSEKDARQERMDLIKQTIDAEKKNLRSERRAEITHLQHLIALAEEAGLEGDPWLLSRIGNLKKQMASDVAKEKPLQITMPLPPAKAVKKGRKPGVKIDDEESDRASDLSEGRWGSLMEQGARASWKGKGKKYRASTDESRAEVFVTEEGKLIISSPLFGTIGVSGIRTLPLGVESDSPETWSNKGFDCHVFLENELYTRCDPESDENLNNCVKPMSLSELLDLDKVFKC